MAAPHSQELYNQDLNGHRDIGPLLAIKRKMKDVQHTRQLLVEGAEIWEMVEEGNCENCLVAVSRKRN